MKVPLLILIYIESKIINYFTDSTNIPITDSSSVVKLQAALV